MSLFDSLPNRILVHIGQPLTFHERLAFHFPHLTRLIDLLFYGFTGRHL